MVAEKIQAGVGRQKAQMPKKSRRGVGRKEAQQAQKKTNPSFARCAQTKGSRFSARFLRLWRLFAANPGLFFGCLCLFAANPARLLRLSSA
jgi:hypothetical protein